MVNSPRNPGPLLPELPRTLLLRVPVHPLAPKSSGDNPCLWGRPRQVMGRSKSLGKLFHLTKKNARHPKTAKTYSTVTRLWKNHTMHHATCGSVEPMTWMSLPWLRLERICFNSCCHAPFWCAPSLSLRVWNMFWQFWHLVTRFTKRWPKISKPSRGCSHPWV